jgi:hypothetical protein
VPTESQTGQNCAVATGGPRAPDTLDELRARIRQFAADFNNHWLLERHGYRTHARPATRCVRPPWHDRRVHQPRCPVNRVRRSLGEERRDYASVSCARHTGHHLVWAVSTHMAIISIVLRVDRRRET